MKYRNNLCINFKSESKAKKEDTYWDIVDDMLESEEQLDLEAEWLAEESENEVKKAVTDLFFQHSPHENVTFH